MEATAEVLCITKRDMTILVTSIHLMVDTLMVDNWEWVIVNRNFTEVVVEAFNRLVVVAIAQDKHQVVEGSKVPEEEVIDTSWCLVEAVDTSLVEGHILDTAWEAASGSPGVPCTWSECPAPSHKEARSLVFDAVELGMKNSDLERTPVREECHPLSCSCTPKGTS